MKASQNGIALIKRFEGLELEAYQDIAGVWTIGYGHTETAAPGMKISAEEAEALLRRDLVSREEAVDKLTIVSLNQNEFDALVSFVYNVGIDAYRGSTARRRLNAGDRAGAAEALTWWNKATVGGVLREVAGLTRRRNAEKELFMTPIETSGFDERPDTGIVHTPGASAIAPIPTPSVTAPEIENPDQKSPRFLLLATIFATFILLLVKCTPALAQTPEEKLDQINALVESLRQDFAAEPIPDDPLPAPPSRSIRTVGLIPGLKADGALGFHGPGAPEYYNPEQPFLQILRNWNGEYRASGCNGKNYRFNELFADGHIDRKTYLPKSLPQGCRKIAGPQINNYARIDATRPSTFVATWKGEGRIRLAWDQRQVGPNRVEVTFPAGDTRTPQVEFYPEGDGFREVSVFRLEHEPLIEAGEIWNPDFIDIVGKFYGVRTMDLQQINGACVRSAKAYIRNDNPFWGRKPVAGMRKDEPRGIPLDTVVNLPVAASNVGWFHIPHCLGLPREMDVPGIFDVRGQADQLRIHSMVAAVAVEIFLSDEHREFADLFVEAMVRQGYPADRLAIFALGNENWNTRPGFEMTHYCAGIGKALGYGEWGYSEGCGYLSALTLVNLKKSFEAHGRGAQTFILALESQNASPAASRKKIAGFLRYFNDNPELDFAEYLPHVGLATAHYYAGGEVFEPTGVANLVNADEWAALKAANQTRQMDRLRRQAGEFWLDEIEKNPSTMAEAYRDFWLDPANERSIPWMAGLYAQHKAIAVEAGIALIGGYEGGPHLALYQIPDWLKESPEARAWLLEITTGVIGAELNDAWIDAVIGVAPDAIINKYRMVGDVNSLVGWFACDYRHCLDTVVTPPAVESLTRIQR